MLWAAAARDPGDAGPFVSAVYTLGVLRVSGAGAVRFDRAASLTRLWVLPKKVEALDLVPGPGGGVALGTDDEDAGSSFRFP
jgi:hypothetical protein